MSFSTAPTSNLREKYVTFLLLAIDFLCCDVCKDAGILLLRVFNYSSHTPEKFKGII
jgi:hypothetical protein